MKQQIFIIEDMNAYSPIWNPYCRSKKNTGLFKELIDSYKLIVNNDPDYAIRPLSQGQLSIIDLVFTSPKPNRWRIPVSIGSQTDFAKIRSSSISKFYSISKNINWMEYSKIIRKQKIIKDSKNSMDELK